MGRSRAAFILLCFVGVTLPLMPLQQLFLWFWPAMARVFPMHYHRIVLRILGVPQDVVMQDYMASQQHALDTRRSQLLLLRWFKGAEAADKLTVLMGVDEAWLNAAFAQIDASWGSFDNYVREGLKLNDADIAQLRATLLSAPDTTGV